MGDDVFPVGTIYPDGEILRGGESASVAGGPEMGAGGDYPDDHLVGGGVRQYDLHVCDSGAAEGCV